VSETRHTEPNGKVRVLIVDDSPVMRKALRNIVTADPQMEVIGEAHDGREGVELAQALKPDVITMDIEMPRLTGLQATELIMSQDPRPIVIFSSLSWEGSQCSHQALELGAVDFMQKPASGIDLDMRHVRLELTRKLKRAAAIGVARLDISRDLQRR